jgi:hypothetical protein
LPMMYHQGQHRSSSSPVRARPSTTCASICTRDHAGP